MSSLGSPSTLFLAKKKAYEVERSLRFNDNDSAELERTPSSASNRKTFTFSFWVKRANLGIYSTIFGMQYSGSANQFVIRFDNDDKLTVFDFRTSLGGMQMRKTSNAVFRDVSAWYHIVVAVDTTQSTGSNRNRVYVNNNELTSFSSENTASQNHDTIVNTTNTHYIGQKNSGSYFDGYLAEFNFIDGFQYDPSYFAETNATTGQWNPKKYDGGYGTNGFYLNFSDNSAATATTLGKDSSGNGNNFTPTNFSVSAGVGNDSLEDTPTNNFCTMNRLDTHRTNTTLAEGNLKYTHSSNNFAPGRGTFAVKTGKWYFEFTKGSGLVQAGFANTTHNIDYNGGDVGLNSSGSNPCGIAYDSRGIWYGYTGTAPSSIANDDIIGVAFDADNFKFYFHKNGTYYGSGDPSNDTNGIQPNASNTVTKTDDMLFAPYFNGANGNGNINFGQRPFSYSIPTGYKKLNSANLPDPTILLPNKHFDILLWTGNGATNRAITGLDFAPDWVWLKSRTETYNHQTHDTLRGVAGGVLYNNTTAAEDSTYSLASFDANGFTVAKDGNQQAQNNNGQTFVSWNWNAGDTDGKTYTVKVVSDSGNKYRFDDFGTSAVTLDLAEGGTYIFDQSDSSNAGHPLRFYTAADKTGGEYTTGVTTAGTPGQAGAYTQIVVAVSAPTLFYQCSVHAGMGGQANTNSTLGSSNFDGTIQSTAKVNATAGFSVTTYSGTDTGSSQTIGHGLGVAPKLWIFKNRSSTANWVVYTTAIDGGSDYLILDSNNASTSGVSPWDTAPTSSVITVGTNNADTCNAGDNYVLYAFSEVAGYSKFGSYTGNGNANGRFISLGFRPSWFVVKRTDASNNWRTFDAKRSTFNEVDKRLYLDTTNTESTGSDIDFLSNGVKMRMTDSGMNTSGGKYIYLAFAESPFKNARAR